MWGLLTNHLKENKVNDQRCMIDQNTFQRLNIYMFFFFKWWGVIKAIDKNVGDCVYNLGGEEGFSKHNTGEKKEKV